MTDEEVNRIIAEFMGWRKCGVAYESECGRYVCMLKGFIFTKALDALVPVWEKLKEEDVSLAMHGLETFEASFNPFDKDKQSIWVTMNNTQQAAAHVTAKAILELNE